MSTVTARAPGRVNLIGEHLDYNGGLCLPIALPLTTTATVRRLVDRQVRLTSGDLSWTGTLDDRPGGWPAYVTGVLAALEVAEGVEISISSDVPVGAGLSSSAALECSVALAVNELFDLGKDREALAEACIRAENDYVGAPTGGMDQAASLFGVPGCAVLLDFATGSRTLMPFDPAPDDLAVLVVDTGVAHQLADSEYAARRTDCARAADELGITHLAAATYETLPRLSDVHLRRLGRHVVTEQARVLAFAAAIQVGDWNEAGSLMTASHLSLRDDYRVSCVELDAVVTAGLSAGALGARMTGGGFGGSAVLLAPFEYLPEIQARIQTFFAQNGWDAPTNYLVEASRSAFLLPTT